MTSWNLFLVSKIFSPDSTSLELLYTSSPTPSRLVHGPVPRTILPPRNIRTRDSAVPRPNESHFRQQQLSDHTIFVFSIWHGCVGIYRGTGRGEGGEGGAADILFTTIHGGERSSLRGPCTVTTTRKEVDIIPTYDGSYRWHSMARGLRAALCLVILIFKLPTVLLCGVFHLARLPFPCLSVALIRVETTVHGD